MPQALVLSVRFHDGRFHGRPEWPPSPARLFQALLAGAAQGGKLRQEDRAALAWLERLEAPTIAAPAVRVGNAFKNYVPNNDLDAVGGDPRRVAEIRAPKLIRPLLFDAQVPLLYAWPFDVGEEHARGICAMAERVYQFGRGVDMAWASGEIVQEAQLEARICEQSRTIYRPRRGREGQPLLCPQDGSLKSLEVRFAATGTRFSAVKSGRQVQQLFSQAPKPRFAAVAYDSPPQRYLFELRVTSAESSFAPCPLVGAPQLVESLRDCAARRLKEVLSEETATIDRVIIGRGATDADKAARIHIIPLPSIGSPNVVHSIRRVVVEVPPNCPLSAEDVVWTLSGLDVIDPGSGEIKGVLVRSDEEGMLHHYGIGARSENRIWRTVTPAALPEAAGRRRIDPRRLQQELAARKGVDFKEVKPSRERLAEEGRAVAAVAQALRHAGLTARAKAIRVQREPFDRRGARAEQFAKGTRFAKERLWHVEIVFMGPQRGPLVIGDGRYLGLGIMAPVRNAWRDVFVFGVPAQVNIARADGSALVEASRRALMALSRDVNADVPRLFSGHERDGGPASSGRHEHVFIAADDGDGDGRIDRLVIVAPWVCDRATRPAWNERKAFDEIVSRLESVRAGRLGVITLGPSTSPPPGDPLVGPARRWQSKTAYRATRHAGRRKDARAALERDVMAECQRRGLPSATVEILEFAAVPNGAGLAARVHLSFAAAVRGPLLLGRDSHRGGGLFAVTQ